MTANYIGLSQEKQDKYSNDWANVMSDISEGRPVAIENTPVITIRSSDLRDIIVNALKMSDNIESLNSILKKVKKFKLLIKISIILSLTSFIYNYFSK